MSLPAARTGVPRNQVGDVVKGMLTNPDVGDVVCKINPDGTYDVIPKAR